jgi:hypothetical protein
MDQNTTSYLFKSGAVSSLVREGLDVIGKTTLSYCCDRDGN